MTGFRQPWVVNMTLSSAPKVINYTQQMISHLSLVLPLQSIIIKSERLGVNQWKLINQFDITEAGSDI